MSNEGDRRAPGANRIPFEALVEVGAGVGSSFEAQAVNVSEDGMQLRTAYLPDPGQMLSCRFDAGQAESVFAQGEVVWTHQNGRGGEFGIRFTDMDPESVAALRKMIGPGDAAPHAPGAKVRLHIEGLNSPMRARVKKAARAAVTVGSDLGFLQVGKDLHLEDAESGGKRPARVEGVEVEIDQASLVPQLVVSLRYADVAAEEVAPAPSMAAAAPEEEPEIRVEEEAPMDARADAEPKKNGGAKIAGAMAKSFAQVGPTMSKFAKRAKTTIALLAAKRGAGDEEAPLRRTTAPPPGGGLHTAGRKVIRGDAMGTTASATSQEDESKPARFKWTKRRAAIGGAVLVAAVLAALALRKPHDPPGAGATADTAAVSATTTHPTAPPPPTMTAPVAAALPAPAADDMEDTGGPPGDEAPAAAEHGAKKKGGKVTPFSNGPVSHGNVLKLRMDGVIEAIEGAQQPTGFTVKIPGRKSLDAASPLATKDSRIGSVKLSNDPAGAELTVAFKDGVPNYQVRARGDTLEIMLAPLGAHTVAKKDPHAPAAPPKHPPRKRQGAQHH